MAHVLAMLSALMVCSACSVEPSDEQQANAQPSAGAVEDSGGNDHSKAREPSRKQSTARNDESATEPDAAEASATTKSERAPEPEPESDSGGDALPRPQRGLLDTAADPLRTAQMHDEPVEDEQQEQPLETDDIERPRQPVEADTPIDEWDVPLDAFRQHLQQVAYPQAPQQFAMRSEDAYSMAELQAAIASNTVVRVHGKLQADNSNCIGIPDSVHDLIIRFEPDAEIRFNGEKTYAGIFRINPKAQRIRFESPRLTGPAGSRETCVGIEFIHDDGPEVAQDVAIIDGEFRGLNYAIQAHGGCQRLLVQNCRALELIDYFFFGAKQVQDVTIMNCVAHGTRSNHVIRMFDADRVNIFRNDLKVGHTIGGEMKRTIWLLTGQRVTIAANITRDGRITIGPNPVPEESTPNDRIGHVNIVHNRINHTHTNKPINLLSGAHDVFLHGNVITTFSDKWLAIGGWNRHHRPVWNVRWTEGTMLNGETLIGRAGVAINEHYAGQNDIGVTTASPGQ